MDFKFVLENENIDDYEYSDQNKENLISEINKSKSFINVNRNCFSLNPPFCKQFNKFNQFKENYKQKENEKQNENQKENPKQNEKGSTVEKEKGIEKGKDHVDDKENLGEKDKKKYINGDFINPLNKKTFQSSFKNESKFKDDQNKKQIEQTGKLEFFEGNHLVKMEDQQDQNAQNDQNVQKEQKDQEYLSLFLSVAVDIKENLQDQLIIYIFGNVEDQIRGFCNKHKIEGNQKNLLFQNIMSAVNLLKAQRSEKKLNFLNRKRKIVPSEIKEED